MKALTRQKFLQCLQRCYLEEETAVWVWFPVHHLHSTHRLLKKIECEQKLHQSRFQFMIEFTSVTKEIVNQTHHNKALL